MRAGSVLAFAAGFSGVRAAVVPLCKACRQDECMDCKTQETLLDNVMARADPSGSHHQGGVREYLVIVETPATRYVRRADVLSK